MDKRLAGVVFGLLLAGLFVGAERVRAQGVPKLYFQPAVTSSVTGEVFESWVMVDTAGEEAGGVGAKLEYNPAQVEAVEVVTGSLFADYPIAAIDNIIGQVNISGVVGAPQDRLVGEGLLAKIRWRGLTEGITTIRFVFEPGSTRDSNIAVSFGNGDVLAEVGEMKVDVKGAPVVGSVNPAKPEAIVADKSRSSWVELAKVKLGGAWNFTLGRWLGQIQTEETLVLDPYDPIAKLPARTTFAQVDSVEPVYVSKNMQQFRMAGMVMAVASVLAVTALILWGVRKAGGVRLRPKQGGSDVGYTQAAKPLTMAMPRPANETPPGPQV